MVFALMSNTAMKMLEIIHESKKITVRGKKAYLTSVSLSLAAAL
jgi:hypothetical protein